ncbi:WecB/TagA/CpsF family glycosyltransferase [Nostoc sp. TCL26-01]|uniref:WecB/TagA/CpsF family glycosyltransferase n=1 Tax=Nostoc sp. TCL26-01 TaxID=2576904 RepID=UPI0015C17306|nr:WecB/TagA/CpsF family glycosyltransferase [Nostoc sp. TCL26-01]QLE58470.1 WecB/TagA/CpsF family glycosyltransferase [Nostoc sp. TCL26-01]
MKQAKVLNVSINNITMVELLEKLQFGGVVFTPNVNHIMQLQKKSDFYSVYQKADYTVCDSKIVLYASHFLNAPIQEKIAGSDLFPAFCEYYRHDEKIKIFLLGSEPEVVKTAQRKINAKIGRNIVVASHSPSFGFEKNEQECQEIVKLINSSEATVLAIGVGAPKQEMWIAKYQQQFKNIKTFMAIGATIDFEAGYVKRSPRWMSEVGLEWLYRLISEPKRLWKRYVFDAIPFLFLILQQRLNLYSNPWSETQPSGLHEWEKRSLSKIFQMTDNITSSNEHLNVTSETEPMLQEHIQTNLLTKELR